MQSPTVDRVPAVQDASVIVAVMGATGAGKSTFIKHVTGDESIVIGHKIRSETSDVQTYSYVDPDSHATVLLVDMPGFDNSRGGMSDREVLQKIANFLNDKGGRKLNGILCMHPISDVQLGGVFQMNIKMLKAFCGDDGLRNVRIVTNNWDRVKSAEGEEREVKLSGPDGFESLIAGGVRMVRHDNEEISARLIISELTSNEPVLMDITKEMQSGKELKETSVGNIVAEELVRLQKKHEQEMAELRMEMKTAREQNGALLAELLKNQRELQDKMERAAKDAATPEVTRIQELEEMLAQEKSHNRRKGFIEMVWGFFW